GTHKIVYSDYEFIEYSIKSIKDYIISRGYIFRTRSKAPGKLNRKNAKAAFFPFFTPTFIYL
ncbi:MAG TPA: hypothetical protein DCZ23_03140, partial [Lachnospiraceae bacterium]|nr:hypothetical protein [Lachnospiraceae bacterium]